MSTPTRSQPPPTMRASSVAETTLPRRLYRSPYSYILHEAPLCENARPSSMTLVKICSAVDQLCIWPCAEGLLRLVIARNMDTKVNSTITTLYLGTTNSCVSIIEDKTTKVMENAEGVDDTVRGRVHQARGMSLQSSGQALSCREPAQCCLMGRWFEDKEVKDDSAHSRET